MRRFLLLALALSLAVFAVGCGGGEERTTEPETVEGEAPTAPAEEEAPEGDAGAGAQLFLDQGCGNCHVMADAETTGTVGPNLDETQPDFQSAFEQIKNGGGGMPAYEGELSDQEIANIAAYVSESAGG